MKLKYFCIGKDFWVDGKRWRCTDIGKRVVIAVRVGKKELKDPTWLNGPPYAVLEHVFDEYDQVACRSMPLGGAS